MIGYGLFLVATGLYGYQITANHSTSALFNGGVFGALLVVLGILHAYGRTWTHTAALSATIIFCLTFLWRAWLQWSMLDFFGPTHTFNLQVAMLLTVMAAVSAIVGVFLYKSNRR
jgi:uncharacterized membrane protein (UPF0136 family)